VDLLKAISRQVVADNQITLAAKAGKSAIKTATAAEAVKKAAAAAVSSRQGSRQVRR
jgi:hypothetical protein